MNKVFEMKKNLIYRFIITAVLIVNAVRAEPLFHRNCFHRGRKTFQVITQITTVAQQHAIFPVGLIANFAKGLVLLEVQLSL